MSVIPPEPTTRVSPLRVLVLAAVVLALVAGAVHGLRSWRSSAQARPPAKVEDHTLFAGYVDVTATPSYPFESPTSPSGDDVVLAFVVSDHTEPCTPSWGAAYTLDEADSELDLDRRLTLLRVRGGDYTVSFGGADNHELAKDCTSSARLEAAYRSVVERYDTSAVDFDLEGADLADRAANARRAQAVAHVQQARSASGDDLSVWLTLPASPTGLTPDGRQAVSEFLAAGVDLAGVNAMTMDFGASRTAGQTMVAATEQTLDQVHSQVGDLYRQAGHPLDDVAAWAKVGMTPMIGQNDVTADVLTMADARLLNGWARDHGVGRISLWSLNRDASCGDNYLAVTIVSDACSGVDQGSDLFADVLATDPDPGRATPTPSPVSDSAKPLTAADLVDNPRTSPYQIWNQEVTYLAGTRVVWHHTVYVAKWSTTGNLPDDPGLTEFETPWRLLGPVLPGEKPIPIPTVPPGTYPEWSIDQIYLKGQRVVLRGVPYRAKWWNKGESPAVAAINPDATPWATFTATQVRLINQRLARARAAGR